MKKAKWIDKTRADTYQFFGLRIREISVGLMQEVVLEAHDEVPGWSCVLSVCGRRIAEKRFYGTSDQAKAKAEAFTRTTVEALAKALARMPNTKTVKKRKAR